MFFHIFAVKLDHFIVYILLLSQTLKITMKIGKLKRLVGLIPDQKVSKSSASLKQ